MALPPLAIDAMLEEDATVGIAGIPEELIGMLVLGLGLIMLVHEAMLKSCCSSSEQGQNQQGSRLQVAVLWSVMIRV